MVKSRIIALILKTKKPHIRRAWDGYIWIFFFNPAYQEFERVGGNYLAQAWFRYEYVIGRQQ